MSYNGSGTYVPPAGQPVATGTVIQSATFNTLVTDIGNTFNNVLPRDGQAPMQGQLKITDGTSAIPGIGFNSEASSGMYRPVAGALALVASGVENLRINSAGRLLVGTTTDDGTNKLQVNGPTKITGALATTGAIAATGAITSSSTINATGAITAASYTGSNLVLQSSVPFIYLDENDQTGAAGYWRMVADGNTFKIDKNTAAARDFSTYATALSIDTNGVGYASGNVQQGGGTGQGANKVYMGWGSSGGGLKVTVDVTDQGYLPFSSTNPSSGTLTFSGGAQTIKVGTATDFATVGYYGAGAVSQLRLGSSAGQGNLVQLYDRSTGAFTIGNGNNGSEVTRLRLDGTGLFNALNGMIVTGGAAANLTNNGTLQIGSSSALSIAISDQIIQARNVSSVNNLYLNYNGGSVSTGGSSANNSNFNCNGTISATNGLSITGSSGIFMGGNVLSLGNNGFHQIGSSGGLNVVQDYQSIQARNNGAVSGLNLNPLGQTVYCGGAMAATGDVVSQGGSVVAQNILYAKNPGTWMKIAMQDGNSTTSGYIGADVNNCFISVDKNNSAYRFYVSQSGDATANGNVTAYSDERLKTNWRDIKDGFVEHWASVKHGVYDRIDTGVTQAGLSAQSVQTVLPDTVVEHADGHLSLNYGAAAAIASVQLAKELTEAKAMIKRLMEKVGLL